VRWSAHRLGDWMKELTGELKANTAEVYELRLQQAAFVEQDKRRERNRQRRESMSGLRVHPSSVRDDFNREEPTGTEHVVEEMRSSVRPAIERRKPTPIAGVPTAGYRAPRPGTNTD
jgi:hypothetical protein